MAENTINVGNQGRWRIFVQQESQNYDDNSSRVRVVGRLYNDGTARSWSGDNITKYIRGSADWDGSGGFDVPAGGSYTVMDRTFTIDHDSDGNRKVGFKVYYGATGTYTFGTPGWVEQHLTLDRIPQVPKAVETPGRSFTTPNSINLVWGPPDDMGASIVEYQVQYSTASNFSSSGAVSAGTNRNKTISGLAIGTTWYFRVRARNSRGWGPWSSSTYYNIPNTPSQVGTPSISYTPATTMSVSWGAPNNNGATITRYVLQYADNASFYGAKTKYVTTTSTTVNDLTVGKTWYFRVKAENSQGGGLWSNANSYLVVCGPRILVSGVWRNTVAYVNVNGVWKTAIPYVNVAGTYKVAGG